MSSESHPQTLQQRSVLAEPAFDEKDRMKSWKDSDLKRVHDERMRGENDMIVCIAPSSKTAGSGTGKTTAAIQFAREFDWSDRGFLAHEKASLDSQHVADDLYPNLEQKSSILWDESQGTRNSSGADARRAMADAVINVSRAASLYRYKQITLVMVTQSTKWIDSRMMDIIDRLVLIQEVDHDRGIARAVVFDHYFDDLGSSKKEFTPAIEDIYWQPLSHDDPDYQKLHEMKADSGRVGGGDDEESGGGISDLTDAQRKELARSLYQDAGWTQDAVAQHPMIDRDQSWVSRVVNGNK